MVVLVIVASTLLGVTWLVYPAVVVLLARLVGGAAPRAPIVGSTLPSVTCVLATRDELDVVMERVSDFLATDYPASLLTVVVAVDPTAPSLFASLHASTQADERSALADARVRIVRGDAPGGKCPTLNAGVAAATGDMLVFSDARQRFEPTTIGRLVGALQSDARIGATSGRLLLPSDAASNVFRHYLRYELAIRSAESRLHSAVGVSGSVYAMRRALWTPLPGGLILDDLYVPMRLVLDGWRVGFVDDALAFETRRVVASQEYRRKVRTLTGNFQLCAWLPAVLVPLRNAIWIQFVCHKLLRLLTPWCVIALGIGTVGALVPHLWPFPPWLLGLGGVAALWVLAGRDGLSRRLRNAAVQIGSLQVAVVTATANAVRGRWDVWKA